MTKSVNNFQSINDKICKFEFLIWLIAIYEMKPSENWLTNLMFAIELNFCATEKETEAEWQNNAFFIFLETYSLPKKIMAASSYLNNQNLSIPHKNLMQSIRV